jgi:general secretion pathway protein B
MSFILDALRKSEIERQRQSGPSIAEFPVARDDRRLPIALVVIGLLLAVNIAVVVYFMLRDTGGPAAVTAGMEPAAAADPPPAAVPASQPSPAVVSPLESQSLAAEENPEPPAVYYEAPATQAPDAPDPTLLPEAGPGLAYGDAPAGNDFPSVAAVTGLPELTVDLHVFTADPAKRAVFINGRRYTQGARIAEGPMVEEITADGVLLSYRGRRFVLPRL